MSTNILFIGDIVAKYGRKAVKEYLPLLIEKHNVSFVVANAENMAGGYGVTAETLKEIYDAGVDVVTLGNHTWDKKETGDLLRADRKLLRPYNYLKGTVGEGFRVFQAKNGKKIGVLSLLGTVFMPEKVTCPFTASRELMREYRLGTDYDALIVDIHAEAGSEKLCIGHIWDGKASLVVGSHTHIPTADTQIQPKGTAYQTDAGMCGVYGTSLGMTFTSVLPIFEQSGKFRKEIASGEATLCGILVRVNSDGLAESVERIKVGGVLGDEA